MKPSDQIANEAAANTLAKLLDGPAGMVLFIIFIILMLYWLFLPFLLMNRLKKIELAITAAHRELAAKAAGVQQALAPRR